jgi:hypothetical protein
VRGAQECSTRVHRRWSPSLQVRDAFPLVTQLMRATHRRVMQRFLLVTRLGRFAVSWMGDGMKDGHLLA